ncbi:hypothetical protein BKA67DRAFT_255596 [Truncatella angustata]|uniref:Uncharacterized protein n=1 Tax=Truncatella angustata TaxID=152316 RepID=A0A9P8ZZE6_9PEZI|nr:uncharacterized protein BKA67DRAFT_255596 [Truncatella angustata]KAH6656107.1 hypothetical protein BKA67DRAFT_255596 [Truncatella angustata]
MLLVLYGQTIVKSPIDLMEQIQKIGDHRQLVLEDNDEPVHGLIRLMQESANEIGSKAFVVTSSGCVGLAPPQTEDGDIIVISAMLRSSIVLRKEKAESGIARWRFYRMVGRVDIDAMTEGEFAD